MGAVRLGERLISPDGYSGPIVAILDAEGEEYAELTPEAVRAVVLECDGGEGFATVACPEGLERREPGSVQ